MEKPLLSSAALCAGKLSASIHKSHFKRGKPFVACTHIKANAESHPALCVNRKGIFAILDKLDLAWHSNSTRKINFMPKRIFENHFRSAQRTSFPSK
jgi:hypothetical protein